MDMTNNLIVDSPETSYEFIKEWFEQCEKKAAAKGFKESAALWRDGLQHLEYFHAEVVRLEKEIEDMHKDAAGESI